MAHPISTEKLEGIHGIDVGWLHHAQKANHGRQASRESAPAPIAKDPKKTEGATPAGKTNGTKPSPAAKGATSTITSNGSPTPPSMGRRSSWISSLSSKLSLSQSSPQTEVSTLSANGTIEKTHSDNKTNGLQSESPERPTTPTKSQHPSFLSSALRRLSSGSSQLTSSVSRMTQPPKIERRIMNVNQDRNRVTIPGLDEGKMKRVAFSVDVEIAGPKHVADEEEKKSKSGEKGVASASPPAPGANASTQDSVKAQIEAKSNKKEKKKRSEAERKERKEKKRRQAEQNGQVPIETEADASRSHHHAQDKPTLDPARVYRRCCLLRETPIMQKVIEQFSLPINTHPTVPGLVTELDFTGHQFQLADIITLSDFLAIVPVRKLIFENCGLGDEAIRNLLGGLLAVREPKELHPTHTNGDTEKPQPKVVARHGVIDKLTLKNNPRITREGWKYLGMFLYLSPSLRALDLSNNPFPSSPPTDDSITPFPTLPTPADSPAPVAAPKFPPTPSGLFARCLAERLANSKLEELIISDCGIDAEGLSLIVDAAISSGTKRLGVAKSNLNEQGIEHIARYIKSGGCEGLDIGGNDLRNRVQPIVDALSESNPIFAIGLAECNLDVPTLQQLLPALCRPTNLRFLDLSHNKALFNSKPNAVCLLRKYLPKMQILKRIHLIDVDLLPEQAIALAEVVPEVPHLAHLNILENEKISAIAAAQKDESSQEEALALYASLMSAAKVSKTMIAIDVDVPGEESNDILKALAKQIVAYCLRNLENHASDFGNLDISAHPKAGGHREEALRHIVGPDEDSESDDEFGAGADEDYVLGGTAVVKALGICLGSLDDPSARWLNGGTSTPQSGTHTPTFQPAEYEEGIQKAQVKPMEMSMNLLRAARRIRERLQPSIAREAETDSMDHRRLMFLDTTLSKVISRFENEYPDSRKAVVPAEEHTTTFDLSPVASRTESEPVDEELGESDGDGELDASMAGVDFEQNLSRRNSEVSLASKALAAEEGQVLRVGHQIRRKFLKPQGEDKLHATTGGEIEAEHLQMLRAKLEAYDGFELLDKFKTLGLEGIMEEIGISADEYAALLREDPQAFLKFQNAQEMAEWNHRVADAAANAPPSTSQAAVPTATSGSSE